jgi:hypothetical protein
VAYTVEKLLGVLRPHFPAKVDALCKDRRRVEHGLTTVGLKIHCLGDTRELLKLIDALGGRFEVIGNRHYARARASVTMVLPPVGSARSAIWLLECIEKYFGHSIFHNPNRARLVESGHPGRSMEKRVYSENSPRRRYAQSL